MTNLNELLNTLAQPTKYEWQRQRVSAIVQVRSCVTDFVTARLNGTPMPATGHMITVLRTKYKITDEELDGPATP